MIINSYPVSLPSEIDQPQPLTLGMLLMMIIRRLAPNPGHFAPQDFYVRNWWQFWVRCKREYLQTLLNRSKWKKHERNLSFGDIVLVQEDAADRKDRSLAGKITEVTRNSDGKARRAEVISWKAGSMRTYCMTHQFPVDWIQYWWEQGFQLKILPFGSWFIVVPFCN